MKGQTFEFHSFFQQKTKQMLSDLAIKSKSTRMKRAKKNKSWVEYIYHSKVLEDSFTYPVACTMITDLETQSLTPFSRLHAVLISLLLVVMKQKLAEKRPQPTFESQKHKKPPSQKAGHRV